MHISFLFRTLMTSIIVAFVVAMSLSYASKTLNKTYLEIASLQGKNVATKVINHVVINNLIDEPFDVKKEDTGMFSYDVTKVNRIVSSSSIQIKEILDDINHNDYSFMSENELEKYAPNGLIYEIPFSLITRNSLFAGLGPNIPVKFSLIGEVIVETKYKIESFGVNNALITLFMDVNFSFGVYLPLSKKIEPINVQVPLSMNVIEGDVPGLIGTYKLGE